MLMIKFSAKCWAGVRVTLPGASVGYNEKSNVRMNDRPAGPKRLQENTGPPSGSHKSPALRVVFGRARRVSRTAGGTWVKHSYSGCVAV